MSFTNLFGQGSFQELNVLADEGNPEAQHDIACKYMTANNITIDLKKAFYWMEKSATQGYVEAQFKPGSIYNN